MLERVVRGQVVNASNVRGFDVVEIRIRAGAAAATNVLVIARPAVLLKIVPFPERLHDLGVFPDIDERF
jgi:hypothetical protein